MVALDLRRLTIGMLFLFKIIEGAPSSLADWESPFICKENYGYYPDPKECSAYYKCNFGTPIKEVCSEGTYFNADISTCDWPNNVNCTQLDKKTIRFPTITPVTYEIDTSSDFELDTKFTKQIQLETTSTKSTITPTTVPTTAYPTPPPGLPAEQCLLSKCRLPWCWCDTSDMPGNLTMEQIPQMILISFEDAINDANIYIYKDLFRKGRNNPNGCGIKGTFFVSHEWTEYSLVDELYWRDHEIASQSISADSRSNVYGRNITKQTWREEIVGQKEIITNLTSVKGNSILGMRAPYLQSGGNQQYEMLYEENFLYDSTITVSDPTFPFTLDYLFSNCLFDPCPNLSYPGVWEIPLAIWYDNTENQNPCVGANSCNYPNTSEGVYQVMKKNFDRHYLTNRAPFTLAYRSSWFASREHKEGFDKFINDVSKNKNVWFVTMQEAIKWMQNPTPLSDILKFKPWSCELNSTKQIPCSSPKTCHTFFKNELRSFKTCNKCPQTYPWVGNPYGIK